MKLSVNWLKSYVNLDGLTIKEISDGITLAGLEVEGTETTTHVTGVVTGRVLSKEKHPNADKLNICSVTDGNDTFQVVCGAPNVEAGQTVAFAKIGAKLPEMVIKEAKIRGVESFGMLCSERELGVTTDHAGILVLPDSTELNQDINDIMGLGDTIFELNVTPNRPDWLSAVGVAREIGAVFDRDVKIPVKDLKENSENINDKVFVKVADSDKSPIYTLRIIKGIKVAPSPLWMQARLRASGIRAINNVVDVTNYILLEFGQPLHAFDINHIKNGITVRTATEGEKIVTLDGKERTLDKKMLVIADDEKPVAIAGVMGGEFSGVTDNTDTVLLECAYFNPDTVRRTSKKLFLSSDSSYRYERGIDWGNVELLSDYAAMFIAEICGGQVLKGKVGGVFKNLSNSTVKSSATWVNNLLGTKISADEMAHILNKLQIETKVTGDELLSYVPSFRVDIQRPSDIAEEVGRLYGYDNIETTIPAIRADAELLPAPQRFTKDVRKRMESLGFNEVVNFSFMSGEYLSMFDKSDKFVKILNPISTDMAWLRSYVFPGVIKNMQTNWNQGETGIRLFEISNSYISNGADKLATEKLKFAVGLMGSFSSATWVKQPDVDPFFYLKGVIDNILSFMRINAQYKRSEGYEFLHPGKSADIFYNDKKLGFIGGLHPDFADKLDMKAPVYICEIDFTDLSEIADNCPFKYSKFSRFPSVERDIALIADKDTEAGLMETLIAGTSELITDVRLFDLYMGKGIDEGKKSIAFRITFSDLTKTLSDDHINPIVNDILKGLEDKFGAKLR